MKKMTKWAGLAAMIGLCSMGFTACEEEGDSLPKYYDMAINLKPTAENLKLFPATVVITNDKAQDTTFVIQQDTVVNLLQGQYNVAATNKLKDVTGKATVELYSNTTVNVEMKPMKKAAIIFKSLYTTGGGAGYVVDQYFEIVNNSDEVQYLDGIVLSAPTGNQTQPNAWQANGYTDIYESGQGQVLMFPGTGEEHPLQPGESIVLANNACRHDTLAKEGNHCPDLSMADWEIFLPKANGDVDYDAPNVEVLFTNNNFMKAFGLGFFGRGYLLARFPEGVDPYVYAADSTNMMYTPGTESKYLSFLMIPDEYVLDAVDIWNAKSTEHVGTFLPQTDAQGVLASEAWQGKCVRRKVTKIENGRAYYQDTNNSANDFLNNQPLEPGKTPTTADM